MIVDLYQKGNKFGVFADQNNPKPAGRLASICITPTALAELPPEEKMERIAAVIRVYLNEAIIGGATHVRNPLGASCGSSPACAPGCIDNGACPDWSAVAGKSLSDSCMQGSMTFGPEAVKNCMKCRGVSRYEKDFKYHDANCQKFKWKQSCNLAAEARKKLDELAPTCPPQTVAQCGDKGPVHGQLQAAYSLCWALPVYNAGILRGDCTNFPISMLKCAGFAMKEGAAHKLAMVKYAGGARIKGAKNANFIDPEPWKKALKPVGGPKFLDFYHAGTCHSFMYVRRMGLKTVDRKFIYWAEMGGGGTLDLIPGVKVKNGLNAPAHKGVGVPVRLHFGPTITAMSALGCYGNPNPGPDGQPGDPIHAIRMLDFIK